MTHPIGTYRPDDLSHCPRAWRAELDRSALIDGHRRHSVLSLAATLGVQPVVVHDVLHAMVLAMLGQGDGTEITTGNRYGGSYELPEGHIDEQAYLGAGDDPAALGDEYLTDDAIAWVLDQVRPAVVTMVRRMPAVVRR